jgi:hypothetical protein
VCELAAARPRSGRLQGVLASRIRESGFATCGTNRASVAQVDRAVSVRTPRPQLVTRTPRRGPESAGYLTQTGATGGLRASARQPGLLGPHDTTVAEDDRPLRAGSVRLSGRAPDVSREAPVRIRPW